MVWKREKHPEKVEIGNCYLLFQLEKRKNRQETLMFTDTLLRAGGKLLLFFLKARKVKVLYNKL